MKLSKASVFQDISESNVEVHNFFSNSSVIMSKTDSQELKKINSKDNLKETLLEELLNCGIVIYKRESERVYLDYMLQAQYFSSTAIVKLTKEQLNEFCLNDYLFSKWKEVLVILEEKTELILIEKLFRTNLRIKVYNKYERLFFFE